MNPLFSPRPKKALTPKSMPLPKIRVNRVQLKTKIKANYPEINFSHGEADGWSDFGTHMVFDGYGVSAYFNQDGWLDSFYDDAALYNDRGVYHYRNGFLHKDNEPALVERFEGSVRTSWFKHGKAHREDGPATVIEKNGKVLLTEYALEGKIMNYRQWLSAS